MTRRQNTTIIYSMTGGVVPPYLQLGTTDGLLTGFCEYVPIPKTYYFNITANDGFQVIERQFTINVRKVYGDQFFTLGIPLAGGLKAVWITDSGNIRVRVPQTNTYNQLQDYLDGYDYCSDIVNIIRGSLGLFSCIFGLG